MSAVVATCAVVAACAVAACTASPRPQATGPATPGTTLEDVSVEVLQYRRDEADRMIEVKVRNGGQSDVGVRALEVVAPGFAGPGRVGADTSVAGGRAVDLRIPYGEPQCDNAPAGDLTVSLWVEGSPDPIRLRPDAGTSVLHRIHTRECATARALEAAPLRWEPRWVRIGAGPALAVDGALTVGPVLAGHTVEVVGLDGTTLFAVTSPDLPVTVPAGRASTVPVRFQPQRCDPHAVGESKRGYAFGVRVVVPTDGPQPGGAEPVLVTVPPDEPGRAALESALLERCGLD